MSPGLVLREIPVKEHNSLLTILTATDGLVTATAYGARGSGSSLSSGTKLFNYSEFTLLESRGRYKVDSVKSLEQFFALSNSVEGLAAASYFVQLLYDVSLAGRAGYRRTASGAQCALRAGKGETSHGLIKAAFELRLMALSGFEPELDACAGCGSGNAVHFSVCRTQASTVKTAPRRAVRQATAFIPVSGGAGRYALHTLRRYAAPILLFARGRGGGKSPVPLRALYARTDGAQL